MKTYTEWCVGDHTHGVRAVAVVEIYHRGSSLGVFCGDHAMQWSDDANAAFRSL